MVNIHKTLLSSLSAAIIFAGAALPSYAGETVVDILPPVSEATTDASSDEDTNSILRLTPDKSELIRLKVEAGSILIGNPLHINIIADSSKTLVVVPRTPGATHFTVLDKKGQIIMQRHVIVASPKKDYLRVKRVCSEDSEGCQNTSVFYCPDMCHEIGLSDQGNASSDGSASQSSTGSDSQSSETESE